MQVVVDALEPLTLARFWASGLGYEVEDTTALCEGAMAAGYATDADVMKDGGRLYWRTLVGIQDPGGSGPRLLFQRTDRAKEGKNRLHLDMNVGGDRIGEEVHRLTELGATVLYEIDEPAGHHVTMADPEGNEYCVQ